MLNLNLVSENLRHEIGLRRIQALVKKIGRILVSLSIAIALILMIASFSLEQKIESIEKLRLDPSLVRYESLVPDINTYLNFINNIQANDKFRPDFLVQISNLAPENIVFSAIELSTDKKTLRMKGSAKNGDDLGLFKSSLENCGLFQEVRMSGQNIFTIEDVDFEILGIIK